MEDKDAEEVDSLANLILARSFSSHSCESTFARFPLELLPFPEVESCFCFLALCTEEALNEGVDAEHEEELGNDLFAICSSLRSSSFSSKEEDDEEEDEAEALREL